MTAGQDDPALLPPHVTAMLCPEFYPHRPTHVALVQTHISYVFLAGDEVYKVKKPISFSFLDFSTLSLRRHFCHEEVRLNRRLAPDLYRGVVAVCRTAKGYRLGREEDSSAVEYAVNMRRLPADRMLTELLDRNEVRRELMATIAARLAEFHRGADAGPEVRAAGDPAVIARLMKEDFAEMEAFRGRTISAGHDDAIQQFCHDFVRWFGPRMRERQSEGRIRDCHGDLRAEHICVTNGLVIFDCIEFNPQFRFRDIASEIAFLAMDLDYRGHPELADHLIARYASAANDSDLPRLVPFYQCHRAYIRGKAESLKSAAREVRASEREQAHHNAVRHFALAYRYTWSYTACLVAVVGLSGTGKSTLAAALRERTGFTHINSDVVRKQLAGVPVDRHSPAPRGSALYSPVHSARTYAAMFSRAADALAAWHGAIVDATFQRRVDRDAARALAREYRVPLLIVECRCDEQEVHRRLIDRTRRGEGPSDADWQIYCQQRRQYEPFAPDEPPDRLVVDTGDPISKVLAAVDRALRLLGSSHQRFTS